MAGVSPQAPSRGGAPGVAAVEQDQSTAPGLSNLLAWLGRARRPRSLLLLAALAGALFAWYMLGWGGIAGTSDYWKTNHNDSVQSIAGLRYYMNEGWSWPPLRIHSYGVPDGTTLMLTDSIPLLALPAKLLRSVLPAGFHYFGYWVALCFVMQAVAIVALLIVAGFRGYAAALVGSALGLLQVSLLSRFFHAALMGQFLITLTLVAGLLVARSKRPLRTAWWLIVLLLVTFFVHPYLFAMVAVLAAAFVADTARRGAVPWSGAIGWIGGVLAGTVALVVWSGLGAVGATSEADFGYFSMNLLALVSRSPDATGGQYEGFSYLGLGVIGLAALHLYTSRPAIRRLLRKHLIVFIAVLLMAVYAVSSSVFVGDRLLVDGPVFAPFSWLTGRFRSSGRFVWPLVYVTVAAVIVLTVRRFAVSIGVILLVGAAFIQVADQRPTLLLVRDSLQSNEAQVLDRTAWSALIADHALIRMTPHQCVVRTEALSFASAEIQRMAALANVPITTSAAAHQADECDGTGFELVPVPGELRVVMAVPEGPPPPPSDGTTVCVEFSMGSVCSADAGDGPLLQAVAGSG